MFDFKNFDFKNKDATLQDNYRAAAISQFIPPGQPPSTELLMQVVHYIMENRHVDFSVSAFAGTSSRKQSALLLAFELHVELALEQFVLPWRIEPALHYLKNSDASDTEITAGIV